MVFPGTVKLETSEASGVVRLSAPVGVEEGTWLSNVVQYEVEVIAEFADKLILLDEGKINETGTPQEIFPKFVDHQEDVGVRVPQVTELASKKHELFESIPVTLDEAERMYKR